MRAASQAAIIAGAFTALLYTHSGCAPAAVPPRFHPQRAVRGVVRDALTGRPIATAEITFTGRGNAQRVSTGSSRDGSYSLIDVPVGSTGMLRCTRQGFRDYATDFTMTSTEEWLDIELTPMK